MAQSNRWPVPLPDVFLDNGISIKERWPFILVKTDFLAAEKTNWKKKQFDKETWVKSLGKWSLGQNAMHPISVPCLSKLSTRCKHRIKGLDLHLSAVSRDCVRVLKQLRASFWDFYRTSASCLVSPYRRCVHLVITTLRDQSRTFWVNLDTCFAIHTKLAVSVKRLRNVAECKDPWNQSNKWRFPFLHPFALINPLLHQLIHD